MGSNISNLILSVYHYFGPVAGKIIVQLKKSDVPNYRFIKHVSSQWLTIRPEAERNFEQWNALDKYFLSYIPNNGTKDVQKRHYKEMVQMLREPCMKAQMKGPIPNCLYDKGKELLYKLRTKMYKEYVTGSLTLVNSENLIPLKDLHFGEQTSIELQLLKEKDLLLSPGRPKALYCKS